MPRNALAPEVTGINKLVDLVAQNLPPDWFPTAGRTLLETAQGNKSDITEKNFTKAEKQFLRDLIEAQGAEAGAVNYADYTKFLQARQKEGKGMPMSFMPSLFSLGDPGGNVHTTLGQFGYRRNKKGGWDVYDTYDFNPLGGTQEARTGEYGAMGLYPLVRDYAGQKIPPGYGRNVRVYLGDE